MTRYMGELIATISLVRMDELMLLVERIRQAENIYVIGNGGSQATAEHFVVDLIKYGNKRAFSFSSSMLTMASNDYGVEHSFSWILERYCGEKDLIIGISTSGKSPNVRRALGAKRAETFLISGKGGKDFFDVVDGFIEIPSEDTQILEDVSLIISHMVSRELERGNQSG